MINRNYSKIFSFGLNTIFIVPSNTAYSPLGAIAAIATKSSGHFRYTLRCILFEFRDANPDIAARALTWATRFFFHLGTTPPWPSPFYKAPSGPLPPWPPNLQGSFGTPPGICHRISTPPATIAKDQSPGTTPGRALQPAVYYPHISEDYSEDSSCNARTTPTYILRPQVGRFLVCTRWMSNKISKKPFFDKKWNFLVWSYDKNRNHRMTWSFSGFSPLQPGFDHREHRNPYFSNLAVQGGRGVQRRWGGVGGTLTHFSYPAVASH